jgi:hypothetical protein
MKFGITYTVGRVPYSEIITCDTVGELSIAIQLVMIENDISRNQITIHEL